LADDGAREGGERAAILDGEVPQSEWLAKDKRLRYRGDRARNHRRIDRDLAKDCTCCRCRDASGPVTGDKPVFGYRSGPVGGLGACRYCGDGKQRHHRSGCRQMCAHL